MFLSPYKTIYPYLSMRFHFLTPLSGIRYRLMLTSDSTTWSTYVKYRIHQFTLTQTQMNANILYRWTDHHHLVGKSSWNNREVGRFENSKWHVIGKNVVRKIDPKLESSTEMAKWQLMFEKFQLSWKDPWKLERPMQVGELSFIVITYLIRSKELPGYL